MQRQRTMIATQGNEGGKTENPQSIIFFHKSHLYMYGELGFSWFDEVIKKKVLKFHQGSVIWSKSTNSLYNR